MSFKKALINIDDLTNLYTHGCDIHSHYLIFEILKDFFVVGIVLVPRNIHGRLSTVGDLITELKNKLGNEYDDILKTANKNMDLYHFAFSTLEPSALMYQDTNNRVYNIYVNKSPQNHDRVEQQGPIVLSPSRTPGEFIGPLDPM